MKKALFIFIPVVAFLLFTVISCQFGFDSPNPPVLKTPQESAKNVELTPDFDWSFEGKDGGEDKQYHLKIYEVTTGGTELVLEEKQIGGSTYRPEKDLSPSTTYSWKVGYTNKDGENIMSQQATFTTKSLPELLLDIPGTSVEEGDTLTIDLDSFISGLDNADPDYSIVRGPGKMKADGYSFSPGFEDSGSYLVEIKAKTEHRETSNVFEVAVLNVHRPPEIKTLSESYEIKEGENFRLNLKDKIESPDSTNLLFRIVDGPGVIKDGIYQYEPDFGRAGKEKIRILVEDPATEVGVNFHLSIADVNRYPRYQTIPLQQIQEGESLSLDLKKYVSDPDNDDLSFQLLSEQGTINDEGIYTFEPGFEDSGDYIVRFEADDGKHKIKEDFEVRVQDKNRKPDENPNEALVTTVSEGATLDINLKKAFSDPDGDALAFKLVSGPGAINEKGIYTYKPGFDEAGKKAVVFSVQDGKDTLVKEYTLDVSDVNRAPTLRLKEAASKTTVDRTETDITWSASDPDNDTLSYNIYFGKDRPPELVETAYDKTEWSPEDSGIAVIPGKTYYWKITAEDTGDESVSSDLNAYSIINNPPSTPVVLSPKDKEKAMPKTPVLEWKASDKENDTILYDLYFSKTATDLTLLKSDLKTTRFSINALETGEEYFWQVVAKDSFGGNATSAISRFVVNQPPKPPQNPGISDNATDVSFVGPLLEWNEPENPDDDKIVYDLYIGQSKEDMKLVARGLDESRYEIPGLCGSTRYYWQLVARDELGAESQSPVWTFETQYGPGAVEWVFKTKYDIRSSPAVAPDGTIYFGADDDYLYAVNRDGKMKWKFNAGNVIYPSPAIGKDGRIYIAAGHQYIYAITENGELAWKQILQGSCYSSPAIGPDGSVYIGDSEGYLNAYSNEGELLWRFETRDEIRSSPAVGYSGTIYVGSDDGSLYAVSPSGELKWQFESDGFIRSSPALDEDEQVYFGSFDGHLYTVNKNGALLFKYSAGSQLRGSPSVYYDGTVYIGGFDGKLHAVGSDGKEKWVFRVDDGPFWSSSPAIGEDGTVYIGTWENRVIAVNPEGQQKWNFDAGNYIRSSPVIDDEGILYIGTYGSRLYAIRSNSTGLSDDSPWPMFRKDARHTGSQ